MSRRRARRRRLGTAVLTVGTLGSVVSAWMWLRSEERLDEVAYRYGPAPPRRWAGVLRGGPASDRLYMLSCSGALMFGRGESVGWYTRELPDFSTAYPVGPEFLTLPTTLLERSRLRKVRFDSITDWQVWGVGVFAGDQQAVVVPWSLVLGLFGTPAAVVACLRRRRGKPIALTQCEACDYPLGAADERGVRRCSECGWVAPGPRQA